MSEVTEFQQQGSALSDPLIFQPHAGTVAECLPRLLEILPDDVAPSESHGKYIPQDRSQKGVKCPACEYTWTSYKSHEKRDKDWGGSPTGVKGDKFHCHAAINADTVLRPR